MEIALPASVMYNIGQMKISYRIFLNFLIKEPVWKMKKGLNQIILVKFQWWEMSFFQNIYRGRRRCLEGVIMFHLNWKYAVQGCNIFLLVTVHEFFHSYLWEDWT
jgi:hypothetical protein